MFFFSIFDHLFLILIFLFWKKNMSICITLGTFAITLCLVFTCCLKLLFKEKLHSCFTKYIQLMLKNYKTQIKSHTLDGFLLLRFSAIWSEQNEIKKWPQQLFSRKTFGGLILVLKYSFISNMITAVWVLVMSSTEIYFTEFFLHHIKGQLTL